MEDSCNIRGYTVWARVVQSASSYMLLTRHSTLASPQSVPSNYPMWSSLTWCMSHRVGMAASALAPPPPGHGL